MSMTDPIADMLTVIRNGILVRREKVDTPHSKLKVSILEILRRSNFIDNYEVTEDGNKKRLQIGLLYDSDKPAIEGLRRVSKPGLRVYMNNKELSKFFGSRGISVISTPEGVMTSQQAWKKGIGGELLCHVW
ncbi:MAG: 30S ribosomal protein S8 [SAR202 cluster bacterium]|nr:30S ribosomal protein S8 [SAR202 cluster bacterium]